MAKAQGVNVATIRGLAGVLDFYKWKGIWVVRRWPKKTTKSFKPAVVAAQVAFAQSRTDLKSLSTDVRNAYTAMTRNVGEAWLDFYTHQYMSWWGKYHTLPPVLTDYQWTPGPGGGSFRYKTIRGDSLYAGVVVGDLKPIWKASSLASGGVLCPKTPKPPPDVKFPGVPEYDDYMDLGAIDYVMTKNKQVWAYLCKPQPEAIQIGWNNAIDNPWGNFPWKTSGLLLDCDKCAGDCWRYIVYAHQRMFSIDFAGWYAAFPGVDPEFVSLTLNITPRALGYRSSGVGAADFLYLQKVAVPATDTVTLLLPVDPDAIFDTMYWLWVQVPTWAYTHWGQNECGVCGWEKVDNIVHGEVVAGATGWAVAGIYGVPSGPPAISLMMTNSAGAYGVAPFIPIL